MEENAAYPSKHEKTDKKYCSKSGAEKQKQKVYAAANSAIRNTGKVLEFNSKASFYKSSA